MIDDKNEFLYVSHIFFQITDFAYEFECGDQPLSLQDELNMSEQVNVEEQQLPRGTSHFRQIFSKIFNLLQSTHADENVT